MKTLSLAVALLATTAAHTQHPRAVLIEARNLAYDANYRNDQAGLRAAIDAISPLLSTELAADAHYYLWFANWALSGSYFQEQNFTGALATGNAALANARKVFEMRPRDPEAHAALANALVTVMILDRSKFQQAYAEMQIARASALNLGAQNPRVLMMNAGVLFNDPAVTDGQARGLARWLEAMRRFEAEAQEARPDALAPRWGQALAHGWLAGLYLRMAPPRTAEARRAAEAALSMRPDFWWVKTQIVPKLPPEPGLLNPVH